MCNFVDDLDCILLALALSWCNMLAFIAKMHGSENSKLLLQDWKVGKNFWANNDGEWNLFWCCHTQKERTRRMMRIALCVCHLHKKIYDFDRKINDMKKISISREKNTHIQLNYLLVPAAWHELMGQNFFGHWQSQGEKKSKHNSINHSLFAADEK